MGGKTKSSVLQILNRASENKGWEGNRGLSSEETQTELQLEHVRPGKGMPSPRISRRQKGARGWSPGNTSPSAEQGVSDRERVLADGGSQGYWILRRGQEQRGRLC